MTINEAIRSRLEAIPAHQRREVLRYVDELAQQREARPLRSPFGTVPDAPDLTLDDLQTLRREIW